MATSFSTLLKLALPTQGELSGSWGDVVNNNITSMVEEAIAGLKTINTWSGNSATLSTANGTTAESRAAILNLTDTTTDLSGAATLICPALSKVYIVKNAAGQAVTIKTASGSGIAIPNGTTGFVYCDGTNVVESLNNVTGNLTVGGNASIGGNLTVTGTATISGSTLTANTAFVPDASDGATLGTSALEFSDLFLADGAVINFGDDQDVTLTHVADTGLLLSSTDQLQFGDSGTYIHQSADGVLDLVSDTEIEINATTIDMNGALEVDGATTFGVDDTGVDVKFFGATSGSFMLWDESADSLLLTDSTPIKIGDGTDFTLYHDGSNSYITNSTGALKIATETSGIAVTIGHTTSETTIADNLSVTGDIDVDGTTNLDVVDIDGAVDMATTLTLAGNADFNGDLDVDGTTNLDAVDIDGAVQIDNTVTIGANDQGYDVIFYGDTASANMTWDTSADDLILNGAAGLVVPDGQLTLGSVALTFKDEDDLSSDSATSIPSQQSVKAYVDTNAGSMSSFYLEDDDGTEVTINNSKEVKFIGSGITTNWTDTSTGNDGDPYDMTFTVDAAQTGITSLLATDIKIGEDDQTKIDFETPDEIHFYAANVEQVYVGDNIFGPQSDSDVDLGSTGVRWKDAFVDSVTVTGAATVGGRVIVDDTTEATSTTDGSLQTDGGLSVAKDAVIGDDLKLLSDSAVLSLGAGNDATLTHDGTTGVTIAANPITIDSGDALNLDAHTGIFVFKDAGSEVLRFTEGNSGDVTIKLATNAKDLVFTDNGDATNMKILDAAAGINVPGEVQTTKIAFTDGDDAMTVSDGGSVTFADDVTVTGRATPGTPPSAGSATTGTVTFDLATNNNFHLTTSGNVTDLTFSNHNVAGQTGTIKFVNSGHTLAVNDMVAINASALTALQTAGTYMLTYLVTATGGGDNTIFISSTGALT